MMEDRHSHLLFVVAAVRFLPRYLRRTTGWVHFQLSNGVIFDCQSSD